MTYADYLSGISGDLRTSRPAQALDAFFAGYRMYPDVRDTLIDEFYKYGSLYRVIRNKIHARDRLREIIQHALDFSGNVALNVTGEPRIGKSTLARWVSQQVHRIQFGTLKGWENRLLFARSYSRATEQLSLITKRFIDDETGDQAEIDAAVLGQLQGYCLIEDENQIEHEKDSVKAKEDMTNIAETCASSGIHFLYLSPKRRGFGYATLFVVGIDPVTQRNLSFYQDNQGNYRGYLETPNIPPLSEYITQKNRVVVQTLVDRGRVKAKAIEFGEQKDVPVEITVPPDADFIQTLESFARFHLQPLVKKSDVVERWILYYFGTDMTHKKIAQQLDISSPDTVGVSIRALDEKITNTLKGTILEESLCFYLNQRFRSPSNNGFSATDPSPTSSTEPFRRLGGRGRVDVEGPAGIAVNCKLFTEHRASWQLHCSPEHQQAHPYLLLCTLTPRHTHTHVYPITTEYTDTGSVEELEWEDWLAELRELLAKAAKEE